MSPRIRPVLALFVVASCGARSALEVPGGDAPAFTAATSPAPSSARAVDASVSGCGNGSIEPGEECDDGNQDDADACRSSCKKARCGDGIVWSAVELCDDGNTASGDGCTPACGPETCGNGKIEGAEVCDDGNRSALDDCLPSCLPSSCGDGFIQAAREECDDANARNDDVCVNCKFATCGDGFRWADVEACDDGNRIDDDACDNGCHLPVCGDGVREGAEECDLGPGNGDRPAFEITQPNGLRFSSNPIVRRNTSTEFYSYSSASSHTGFEEVGESRLYFHVDGRSGRLSLVVTHGIDIDSSGLSQPNARVNMDITGLPFGAIVDLADDFESEFFLSSPFEAQGRWVFGQNSDGGVIGNLPFPGRWTITVRPEFVEGIARWGWVKDTLARVPLSLREPVTIESFDLGTACRETCVRPRCGDRVLDAGEVCDDGNARGGDGCAADCRTFD